MKPIACIVTCIGLALFIPVNCPAADIKVVETHRIEKPPAGKALINLHVTIAPFRMRTPIFDETGTLITDLPVHSASQLVCDPGVKSFFTQVQGGGESHQGALC